MLKLNVYQQFKRDKGLCVILRCHKPRGKKSLLCYMHRSRRAKQLNPFGYHFNALRNNARRRGKEFTLTLSEFKRFCAETGYMEKKGKGATNLSIDRKDHSKGYRYDNLQVLTLGDNVRKRYVDYYNEDTF